MIVLSCASQSLHFLYFFSMFLKIAINCPLYKIFEYSFNSHGNSIPSDLSGRRVIVSFRNSMVLGIIIGTCEQSSFPGNIKEIIELLDDSPVFDSPTVDLLKWASGYYHYPIGEVFYSALPIALKKNKKEQLKPVNQWHATENGDEKLIKRSALCKEALKIIKESPRTALYLKEIGIKTQTIKKLSSLNLIKENNIRDTMTRWYDRDIIVTDSHTLNEEQLNAFNIINNCRGFKTFVLHGVTGSGKTEVYLQLIAEKLREGRQALILVPEINLTPQTISRFFKRFNVPIVCIHSSLSETERHEAFIAMKKNEAAILIGTRSALFSNIPNLGIIIIDEEHDSSYRQADGFRYNARDCAVMMAYIRKIPIVLGTATPSIETCYNILRGKYEEIRIDNRAGASNSVIFSIIDMRKQYIEHGISRELALHINEELAKEHQVMLLLNRRGYSQKMICHNCGFVFMCQNCDANLTYHQTENRLICHHCETRYPVPVYCPKCGNHELTPTGNGTEQILEHLSTIFPNARPVRMDRDTTSKKGSLNVILNDISANKYNIIIGTQMLAKGHHFPNVTLVGIIDIDSQLYSNNFRASENLAQLIVQIAGRAGRGNKQGYVYLQTHTPEHPLLTTLINGGYDAFSQKCLLRRMNLKLPPATSLAVLKVDGTDREKVVGYISDAYNYMLSVKNDYPETTFSHPVSAFFTRRQNRYHYYINISSLTRKEHSLFIEKIISVINSFRYRSNVHCLIEVDPLNLD